MIRVLIVEQTPLQGDMVAKALESQADLEVVAKVGDARAALAHVDAADVVVATTLLSDTGAREVVDVLVRARPDARVVVSDLPRTPPIAVDYLEAGARGYLYRGESLDALIEQIRAVACGESIVDPVVAGRVVERIGLLARLCLENEIDIARTSRLTDREWEVLRLIERGASNKEIASTLDIGVGTVKNHVHSILQKLGVSSREDAALYLRLLHREERA